MCGIFGGVGIDEETARDCLAEILRGNDGSTIKRYDDVILCSRRHLVKESHKINLPEGQSDQPYESDDFQTALVFNGELYTFAALRSQLIEDGFHFNTTGDTEVFLRLYEKYGVDFVNTPGIDSMFALAILDRKKNKLIITRDWPGRVPLFYYYDATAKVFLFSSELKGFRRIEWLNLEDPVELKPGAILTLDLDSFELTNETFFKATPKKIDLPLLDVGEKLHALLLESGKNRTMGDVPICTMFSGGIDSIFTSYAVFANIDFQKVDFKPVSYVYQIDEFESEDVRRAKNAAKGFESLGLELKVIKSSRQQLVDDLPHIVELFETRKIRALSVYPLPIYYYLAPAMKNDGFKVTVGGHGVDELLGAYDSWKELDKSHAVQTDVRSRLAFINSIYENMMRRASIIFMNRGPIEARFPFLAPPVCEYMLGIDPKWLSLTTETAELFLTMIENMAGPKSTWSTQLVEIIRHVTAYLDNNGSHPEYAEEAEILEIEKLFWKLPLIAAGMHAASNSWLGFNVLFNAKLRGQHGSGITSLEPLILEQYQDLGSNDGEIFQSMVDQRLIQRHYETRESIER